MWCSKNQRKQYFEKQIVSSNDERMREGENGTQALYIETWRKLLTLQRAIEGGHLCLYVGS